MPELVDVEGFLRVARRAEGARIRAVAVHDSGVLRGVGADALARRLRGERIGRATRRGEWLLVGLVPSGASLVLHFGMTGSLHWCDAGSPRHRHDRVEVCTDAGVLRCRDPSVSRPAQAHRIRLADDDDELERLLTDLGPDALSISARRLAERLRGRRRGVKSALLDQAVLAGLGNLLVDETLWRARLHPRHPTAELDYADLDRLATALRHVLREGRRVGRSDHRVVSEVPAGAFVTVGE